MKYLLPQPLRFILEVKSMGLFHAYDMAQAGQSGVWGRKLVSFT